MSQEQLSKWENRTTTPLVVIAVLFLGAYAWPILDTSLPAWAATLCTTVSVVVWVVFALDLVIRLRLAPDNLRFLRRNWLDVPTLAAPMLRPLRALRVVMALNMLGRRGKAFLRGQVVGYVVVAAVAVICVVAALAVLDAERANRSASITSFGDALWWAVTTVTTVGYGDRYPSPAKDVWSPSGSWSPASHFSVS